MDDAESESKVSESVKCTVYCLVQVGAVDRVVTIAEEKPATSGDKVSILYVLEVLCQLLQGEKCFCAKAELRPTIGESDESVSPTTDKVCVFQSVLCCVQCYFIIVQ